MPVNHGARVLRSSRERRFNQPGNRGGDAIGADHEASLDLETPTLRVADNGPGNAAV